MKKENIKFEVGQYFRGGATHTPAKIIKIDRGAVTYKCAGGEIAHRTRGELIRAFTREVDASVRWYFVSKLEGMIYVGE